MTIKQIRSSNPKIQNILDAFSRLRQRIIKEGTVSARFYGLSKQFVLVVLELVQGNFRQAIYMLRFRLTMFIRQGYEVDPYFDWIVTHELSPYEVKRQRSQAQALPQQPLISVVTPVFRPPARVLMKMLDSVASQTYCNWEHCLVNADPGDEATSETLGQYAQRDHRVHWKSLDANLGISGNTNEAIQMAKGEWIAFLDHDDQLSPFALFEVAKLIDENPEADVIY
jgi:hypothetical protein